MNVGAFLKVQYRQLSFHYKPNFDPPPIKSIKSTGPKIGMLVLILRLTNCAIFVPNWMNGS